MDYNNAEDILPFSSSSIISLLTKIRGNNYSNSRTIIQFTNRLLKQSGKHSMLCRTIRKLTALT